MAALLFFSQLRNSGFADNEGRYAEVAREMLLTGNWITPHLNGEVFLNKPPLTFWLTAIAFRLFGQNEAARVISGLASLGILLLVADMGRRLKGPRTGLWAAAAFLSMAMTPFEARALRPDALVTLFISLSLWGAVRVSTVPKGRDHLGVAAIWAGMGLGVMTKGFLALVLPIAAFAPALLLTGKWRSWRRYCPPWGLLLLLTLTVPWHAAAVLTNHGFLWDYVVNQHLLVFFDRKFPRDHIPHPLPMAWGSLAFRLFPWVLLLPAAFIHGYRAARQSRGLVQWLPLTWFGTIFLFFSLSSGRLEHHFIPLVPAAALLAGLLADEWTTRSALGARSGRRLPGRWSRSIAFGLLGMAGIGGLVIGPRFLPAMGPLAPRMLPILLVATASLALGGIVGAVLMLGGKTGAALGAFTVSALLFAAGAELGRQAVDPIVSVRTLVRNLNPALVSQSGVAHEAGEEYQLCGALNFYLQRKLTLLEPPGFIPPTYLKEYTSRLFTSRERFRAEWSQGKQRYLLFTDPEKPTDRNPEYPRPFYPVARGGCRQVLTNLPLP